MTSESLQHSLSLSCNFLCSVLYRVKMGVCLWSSGLWSPVALHFQGRNERPMVVGFESPTLAAEFARAKLHHSFILLIDRKQSHTPNHMPNLLSTLQWDISPIAHDLKHP